MKICVGKTYKDQNGGEWYIECELKNPVEPSYPFFATSLACNSAYFNESGKSARKRYQLYPIKVKRAGWIGIVTNPKWVNSSGVFGDSVAQQFAACPTKRKADVFLTKELAEQNFASVKESCKDCIFTAVHVEWEEGEG